MFGLPAPVRPGERFCRTSTSSALRFPGGYTNSHLEYVADVLVRVHHHPETVRGIGIARRAPVLRHFTAAFDLV
ncbi:MAG: hypothetical protein LC796_02215 [Acidobacteria bacterium]|nr:hypothetical protein [Acidobacteriota bacterium]